MSPWNRVWIVLMVAGLALSIRDLRLRVERIERAVRVIEVRP